MMNLLLQVHIRGTRRGIVFRLQCYFRYSELTIMHEISTNFAALRVT